MPPGAPAGRPRGQLLGRFFLTDADRPISVRVFPRTVTSSRPDKTASVQMPGAGPRRLAVRDHRRGWPAADRQGPV